MEATGSQEDSNLGEEHPVTDTHPLLSQVQASGERPAPVARGRSGR